MWCLGLHPLLQGSTYIRMHAGWRINNRFSFSFFRIGRHRRLRPATLKLELEGDGQTRRVPVPKVFPCHDKIVHWLDREWVQGQRSHINHDLFIRLSPSTQWITMEKAKRRVVCHHKVDQIYVQLGVHKFTRWCTILHQRVLYRKILQYRLSPSHMDHVVQLKGKSIGTRYCRHHRQLDSFTGKLSRTQSITEFGNKVLRIEIIAVEFALCRTGQNK